MNIELLNQVKDAILAEPDRFNMSCWHTNPDNGFSVADEHVTCDTAHCIGGWASVFSGKPLNSRPNIDGAVLYDAMVARWLLDTPNDRLFHIDEWPHEIASRYNDAEDVEDKSMMAAIAVEAIDDYIATDGWKDVKTWGDTEYENEYHDQDSESEW